CYLHQFRKSCHGAVCMHYFNQYTGGFESCHHCKISSGLRMSCTAKHTAFLGTQRKNMSRSAEVFGFRIRVYQCLHSTCTVMRRDTGSTAMTQQVNTYGKGGLMKGSIINYHRLQVQFNAAV